MCKEKLNEVIIKSKKILQLPDGYHVGIMTGSNTGALESALWSLLGLKGVDILAWENFGKDWVTDVVNQLKIKDVKEVDLKLVRDPPWNQTMMSEAAKLELNLQ